MNKKKTIKNIEATISLSEAIPVGVKLERHILITKNDDPHIADKIINRNKLFDEIFFNKN